MCGISGVVTMYMLGTLLPWRQVALVGLCVPCSAAVFIFIVPETPYWLLVHARRDAALRSLCWLRGWVPAANVRSEFEAISAFVAQSNVCPACQKKQEIITCAHASGYWRRCLEMFEPNTMRPLLVVAVCFTLTHTCGMSAIRPFLVQIVTVFRVPVDAGHFAVIVGLMELAAYVMLLLVMRLTGKRRLLLTVTALAGASVLTLSALAFWQFPVGASSFDERFVNEAVHDATGGARSMLALVMFVVMAFCAGAASGIPWMLLSEVYPIR